MGRYVQILSVVVFVCLVATQVWANEGHEEPRWGDFAYRVVNFIIFFGILWYFTGKLIKNYFRGRRQGIQDTLDNLDLRRENAQKKLSEVEAHIANLEAERKAILDESRSQAEALKTQIIDDAKRQAEQIVAQAKLSAENEGRSILASVRSTLADEIVDAAEKLLRENLGPAEHKKLITNSLNKVVLH
ncbi:MAG: ATP synthase F0 subunit B [Desulfovibrio sp.]|nr:ATP synthase F0 subunit B [Desulfovibrio sp.]